MCDFTDGFKLCTCTEDETDMMYRWQLKVLEREEDAQGRCIFPIKDFGNGLEFEWVKLHLEEGHCFDFEYLPNEGDNLVIHPKDHWAPYLSLIYKEGEWIDDFYDEISEMSKVKSQGVVKPL